MPPRGTRPLRLAFSVGLASLLCSALSAPARAQDPCDLEARAGLAAAAGQLADRVTFPGGALRLAFACTLAGRVDAALETGGQLFNGDGDDDRLFAHMAAVGGFQMLASEGEAATHRLSARLALGWTDVSEISSGAVTAPLPPDADVDRPDLNSSGLTVAPGLRWERKTAGGNALLIDVEWNRVFLDRILVRDGQRLEAARDGVSTFVVTVGLSFVP